MQQRKFEIAEKGNSTRQLENWLEKVVRQATMMADQIMEESLEDNDLLTPERFDKTSSIPQAEHMTSQYGSFNRSSGKVIRRRQMNAFSEERKQPLVDDVSTFDLSSWAL